MSHPKTKTQHYTLYTYDLWGPRGARIVNDVFESSLVRTLKVKGQVYNQETPHEFVVYEPTNKQLTRMVGGIAGATWDGESEYVLYATDHHGDPVCELRRVK